MLVDDIADRIAIAHSAELDAIIRGAWCDHTNGRLTESEIEILDEAARVRREALQEARARIRPNADRRRALSRRATVRPPHNRSSEPALIRHALSLMAKY